ncbi:MAG TPA: hypothetical protein VMF33_01860 [Acidimicrobiales bacterium]|nr:hypothetical protein [Acidimicrobiales bacterium]
MFSAYAFPVALLELSADVTSAQPVAVRAALVNMVEGTVTATSNGFRVEGTVESEDPETANRQLFTTLRRIEPRTTVRAQWRLDGSIHRFVDLTAQRTFADTSA